MDLVHLVFFADDSLTSLRFVSSVCFSLVNCLLSFNKLKLRVILVHHFLCCLVTLIHVATPMKIDLGVVMVVVLLIRGTVRCNRRCLVFKQMRLYKQIGLHF